MRKPSQQIASLPVRKPAAEVFNAVVMPEKLSGYFVQNASGPLVEGTTVKWKLAEAPGEHDVVVRQVVKDRSIVFEWPSNSGGYHTRVEMAFLPIDDQNTMVQINESGWKNDEGGVRASYGNAGGWMHMMCCLKAYLEYGINLRSGGAL